MAVGIIRNLCSAKKTEELIGKLNELPITLPSSTSSSSSTKRTFAKNSLIEHIARSNEYNTSYGRINSRTENSITLAYYGGYTIGIVTNCEPGKRYVLRYSSGRSVTAMFYASDGTFIGNNDISNSIPFEVPINAEYTIILPQGSSSETYTFTLLSLRRA